MWDVNGRMPLVVFANLDGVLLDRNTSSADLARPALALLAANRVPLVLISPRTRAEIEVLQEKLGIRHPFLSENGAALYVPAGYFADAPSGAQARSGYHVIEIGLPYRDVVSTLHRLARQLHVGIESFSQMSVEEVSRAYGVPLLDARLAKLRDHAEPFRFTDATPKARARLFHALQVAGFSCLDDGRFHHAVARTDIGAHVRLLRDCYAGIRPVVMAGLADRIEDLPLLEAVDLPYIVQSPAGRSSIELLHALPHAVLTRASGPAGFAEGITPLLQRYGGVTERTAA